MTERWYWALYSDEYGHEHFGPYDTKDEADAGIVRVKEAAEKRYDGIRRFYSPAYPIPNFEED